ncbi:MAG: hypothetical protein AAF661_10870 [Pseudomonadota bacterium]
MRTLMKRWAIALVAMSAGLLASSAQAQQCVIYDGENYSGNRFSFRAGQSILTFNRFNNNVESIRVARGCRLRVFDLFGGQGARAIYDRNTPSLDGAWRDRISGAACECGFSREDDDDRREYADDARGASCEIYENADFRGDSYRMRDGEEALRFSSFWNNRVSSVRVARGCRLIGYDDFNGRGAERVFRDDVSYVGRDWNDRMSGAVCQCGRSEARQQGRGDPPSLRRRGSGCVAYARRNFEYSNDSSARWRHFVSDGDFEPLGRFLKDRVSSIRVAPGCTAMVDIGADYKIFVDRNVSNLGRVEDRADAIACSCR